MLPFTGAAALHVLLMRISHAQDAYAVYGLRPDSVYTHSVRACPCASHTDMQACFDEVFAVFCDHVHNYTLAVRMALHPSIVGAMRRATWAMPIIAARLAAMDEQSAGETDTEVLIRRSRYQ